MQSFRRRAKNLDELRDEVLADFGPAARIVDATRITRKGVGRFFAADEVEATIEIPTSPAATGYSGLRGTAAPAAQPAAAGFSGDGIDRAGIAALLAHADRADDGAAVDPPSTASPAFAALLESVERGLGLAPSAAREPEPVAYLPDPDPPIRLLELTAGSGIGTPAGPPPRRIALDPAPGDLVLFVGLGDDAASTAAAIASSAATSGTSTSTGIDHRTSGSTAGESAITGRRDALVQRAESIGHGRAVFVAHAASLDEGFDALAELRPDETWAVVDASRTPADTAEWVSRLAAAVGVHALAVIGTSLTRDAEAVHRLGLPIGWTSADPAPRRA
ncbi:hypothetical protein ACFCVO_09805 [Agromyces sp. NPDC056379]|uniref:hypothetical protein n=1 Tax=unclassified Agromyces TaxID=2639701 RepID=UPI0035D554FA